MISKNTPCRPNRALAGARAIWPPVSWGEFRVWVQEHVCRQWRGTLLSYLGGSRPRGPESPPHRSLSSRLAGGDAGALRRPLCLGLHRFGSSSRALCVTVAGSPAGG